MSKDRGKQFEVYIDGPDEFHGPFDEITALREANSVNGMYLAACHVDGRDVVPMMVAVVVAIK